MRKHLVGRIELASLDDGTFPFPAQNFFRDVPEEAWRAQLDADTQGRIAVGHNITLIDTGRSLIIVDTGYGDDTHEGQVGHVQEELQRAGHRAEEVTDVVITHAHGDHIKGCMLLEKGQQGQRGQRRPAFPRARYRMARADLEWFGGPGRAPEFDEQITPLAGLGLLVPFEGPLRLTPEILLLPTPGHTPGHTSVLIESEGRTALVLGDVCHHPLHFSHPEWVSVYDTHPGITPRTRARLFALAAGRDALLVCPHAPPPGLGRLRRTGDSDSWQALN